METVIRLKPLWDRSASRRNQVVLEHATVSVEYSLWSVTLWQVSYRNAQRANPRAQVVTELGSE